MLVRLVVATARGLLEHRNDPMKQRDALIREGELARRNIPSALVVSLEGRQAETVVTCRK
jgi:hypothetical protein